MYSYKLRPSVRHEDVKRSGQRPHAKQKITAVENISEPEPFAKHKKVLLIATTCGIALICILVIVLIYGLAHMPKC